MSCGRGLFRGRRRIHANSIQLIRHILFVDQEEAEHEAEAVDLVIPDTVPRHLHSTLSVFRPGARIDLWSDGAWLSGEVEKWIPEGISIRTDIQVRMKSFVLDVHFSMLFFTTTTYTNHPVPFENRKEPIVSSTGLAWTRNFD